jgi:hypothetical protein
VYGIVGDGGAAGALAARVRGIIGAGGTVYDTAFSAAGARVWRATGTVSA